MSSGCRPGDNKSKMRIASLITGIAVLALLLELFLFPMPSFSQQTEPTGTLQDEFSTSCIYNVTSGYSESPVAHAVELDLSNLQGNNHSLTMTLNTSEKLLWMYPLVGIDGMPANSSSTSQIVIAANVTGQECWLRLVLNKTAEFADPVNVSFTPYWQDTFPMDEVGHMTLSFWLNASTFLDSCIFRLNPHNDAKIQHIDVTSELRVEDAQSYSYSGEAYFSVYNVTRGDYQISLDLQISGTIGQLDLEVKATQKHLTIPINCYLDGQLLDIQKSTICSYMWGGIGFATMEDSFYYYTDPQIFRLNFTAPSDFVLRIDATSREEIDYIIGNAQIENFSVASLFVLDEPCYEFDLTANADFECSLGLRIKCKGWFVSPENLTLAAIPQGVKNQYLNLDSSSDGNLFDVNDPFVIQWAHEVAGNETNPYVIASSIFNNITRTINSTMNSDAVETYPFKEDVSGILRDRIGVCRHNARAFAALCIISGLPARTVVGTLFEQLNETWKKNHEWVEIYLPGCGWVTVDPTWQQFLYLSNKHRESTIWTQIDGTLVIDLADTSSRYKAKNESKSFIQQLIFLCKSNLNGRHSLSPHAELLLDEASVLAERGSIHDALMKVAEAYLTIPNSDTNSSSIGDALLVICLGLTILAIAVLEFLAKTPEKFLKKKEELDVSTAEKKKKRLLEYRTLNDIVTTRENSTVVVGSIISSASFLILSLVFAAAAPSKLITVVGAILLEGSWLIYYEAAGKLDYVTYDLLRKIEENLGIEVHEYLFRYRQKSGLARMRSHLWKAVFLLVWILGVLAIIT